MSQAAADELQRRLVSFAVKIIELAGHLPKTLAGRHVSGQILRSGTSPAPNYGETRMAPAVYAENLIKENRELACILGASIRTAKAKASRINK